METTNSKHLGAISDIFPVNVTARKLLGGGGGYPLPQKCLACLIRAYIVEAVCQAKYYLIYISIYLGQVCTRVLNFFFSSESNRALFRCVFFPEKYV